LTTAGNITEKAKPKSGNAKPTSVVAHDEPSPMTPNANAASVERIRNTVFIPNRSLR
jgi:hypothetical protein